LPDIKNINSSAWIQTDIQRSFINNVCSINTGTEGYCLRPKFNSNTHIFLMMHTKKNDTFYSSDNVNHMLNPVLGRRIRQILFISKLYQCRVGNRFLKKNKVILIICIILFMRQSHNTKFPSFGTLLNKQLNP
jgi:hypothetical protein